MIETILFRNAFIVIPLIYIHFYLIFQYNNSSHNCNRKILLNLKSNRIHREGEFFINPLDSQAPAHRADP